MGDKQSAFERIEGKLEEHSRTLGTNGRTLDEHGRILREHGRMLGEHGRILREHGRLLRVLVGQWGEIRDLKEFVKKIVDEHERRIQALEKPGRDTLRPT